LTVVAISMVMAVTFGYHFIKDTGARSSKLSP
jgi:hypothetical protein